MNRKEERLSEMILSYLRRHPSAGDTLEGITKWWLELDRIDKSVNEMASVLENLLENGVIRMRKVTNGPIFYVINEVTGITRNS